MLARVPEPEVMDADTDAADYDAMDHSAVNRAFAADLLLVWPEPRGPILDVGTGTAQIPVEIARLAPHVTITAVDAAEGMIALARKNVAAAELFDRITPEVGNARALPYPDWHFAAVVSNSIVHHLSDPLPVFAEFVRVCRRGGVFFVRDLLRPDDEPTLARLVETYAAGANEHQRKLFADSLRAAFTLDEVRDIVGRFGFPPETVRQTSDRHWTWAAVAVGAGD